ncbi:hypothetical protein FB384_003041 [Prauserella sediminis]|uniref:Uncharacterized protein n=1 Tax=Prauserella sediminis TaxID=577680 RepID=A0A839XNB8_9PSEU|nr:hypothetical protein [Prauserella sediminis]
MRKRVGQGYWSTDTQILTVGRERLPALVTALDVLADDQP